MVDLMESPLLKDWLNEAEARGEKLMLIRLLARKFGELPTSLLNDLEDIRSPGRLEQLLDIAFDSETLKEFHDQLNG